MKKNELIEVFKYEDTDGDDIKLEINFSLLKAREIATTYNFNGEIISKNKIVGKWTAKSKIKFFKILENSIGNMSERTRKEYLDFLNKLKIKYKE